MANRYWVGGTASWDGTAGTKWALTSGAAGGQAVPTSSDDVFFDAASGAVTVTESGTRNALSINFTGFTGTFAGSGTLNITGSLTLSTGMTRSYTGALTFNSTATGRTITLNGKTTASTVNFNGSGGGWTLQDAWNNGSAGITLTQGSFDTNGKTVTTTGTFSISGSTTRTLIMGASTINCGTWTATTTTNLTFTPNTSTVVVTSGTFNGGGLTYNAATVSVNGLSSIIGTNTFATLTRTGGASQGCSWTLQNDQIVTGTLTMNGNSTTARLMVQSNTNGTARTLTAATVSASNVDFKDITGAGASTWNLSAITGGSGDCGGNTFKALGTAGFTTAATQTANGTTSFNWSTAARWTSRIPLPQDDVVISNAFGVSQTVTGDMPRLGKSIDWSSSTFTTSLTFTPVPNLTEIFGSLTLKTGMTWTSGSITTSLNGRGSFILTTNGVTIGNAFAEDAPGGTYTLADNLTVSSARNFQVNSGTFTTVNGGNNYNISAGAINAVIGSTLTLGSGIHTVALSGVVLAFTGTVNYGTSTLKLTDTTNNPITISIPAGTIYNLWFDRGASTASNTITNSLTFNDFKDTGTAAHSILFTTGTTQTFTTFTVSGSSGNVITINSTTTGTHALVLSGGGTVSRDYLNIQHSVATPGTTWYAGTHSTDNQAVATAGSGWIFTAPPAGGTNSNFLAFM